MAPPLAASGCEYALLATPFGKDVVVMASAVPVTDTDTLALVVEKSRLVVLAAIVAEPAATPVIDTGAPVRPAPIKMFAGTVAAAGLLEFNCTGRPPVGAGAERSIFMVCTPPAPTETA